MRACKGKSPNKELIFCPFFCYTCPGLKSVGLADRCQIGFVNLRNLNYLYTYIQTKKWEIIYPYHIFFLTLQHLINKRITRKLFIKKNRIFEKMSLNLKKVAGCPTI